MATKHALLSLIRPFVNESPNEKKLFTFHSSASASRLHTPHSVAYITGWLDYPVRIAARHTTGFPSPRG